MNPRAILCFLLLPLGTLAGQTPPAKTPFKTTAERVLNELYAANGNKIYPKPAIEIVDDNRHAAQFVRRTNSILLGKKIFEVCRVFGRDSLSALAFVVGHEMAHSFQIDTRQTSFLAYDEGSDADTRTENEADIQGLFTAWLAGYNTVDLLPYLIEGVYVAYDLKGKDMPGYPTLDERKQVAQQMQLAVKELIRMYEAGNYLAAIGQHELAAACLGYVEARYKSRDVYNNLGINLVLQAMNLSEKNVDPYVFPLELDFETRMKKPKADSGPGDLTPEQWQQRGELLARAADCFALAAKMDYEYLPAETNYLCALTLNARAPEAIAYFESRELLKKADLPGAASERDKIQLALALAYAYNSDRTAFAALESLKGSTDAFVAHAAGYNHEVLSGKKPENSETTACQANIGAETPVDGVQLHRPPDVAWIPLDAANGIEAGTILHATSTLMVFRNKGRVCLSLQLIRKGKVPAVSGSLAYGNRVSAAQGYIEVCRSARVAVPVNFSPNRSTLWVKYYTFE